VSELLVVVDMQNGFLREGNLASDRCLAVLPAVRREVGDAIAAGRRVLFTADTHEIDDAEFAVFPEHCVRGTREADLVDELLPLLDRDDVLLCASGGTRRCLRPRWRATCTALASTQCGSVGYVPTSVCCTPWQTCATGTFR
jgi:nicotinamidase-related amidase